LTPFDVSFLLSLDKLDQINWSKTILTNFPNLFDIVHSHPILVKY